MKPIHKIIVSEDIHGFVLTFPSGAQVVVDMSEAGREAVFLFDDGRPDVERYVIKAVDGQFHKM